MWHNDSSNPVSATSKDVSLQDIVINHKET